MKFKDIQLQTAVTRVLAWYADRKEAEMSRKALEKDDFKAFVTISDDYAEFPFKVVFHIDKMHTRKRAARAVHMDRCPLGA